MGKHIPMVVILGATACGKSKLAIEIARRFGGEIISADSMQVYKGLDIVTNKITIHEQSQAKHHMLNFLDPTQRYSVVDFRNKSLHIISGLLDQDKLPIIVGGTNYYIESLLWKNITLSHPDDAQTDGTILDLEAGKIQEDALHTEEDLEDLNKFFSKPIYGDGFKKIDSEKLWRLLEKIDVKSAHTYHPHDKRRIIRCLQVYQREKRNFSEIFEDLNKSCQSESLGGPLRFDKTCVLWLRCDNDILDKILDERIDEMIGRGLIAELEKFHEDYNKQRLKDGVEPEYDKGIFQSIGFKEFHRYLTLDDATKGSPDGEKVLKRAIDAMKYSTRKYAKRQLKWIRRRFLQSGTRELPAIFKLDTAFDEATWDTQVRGPAFEIVENFISEKPMSEFVSSLRKHPEEQPTVNEPAKYHCDQCDRTFIGSHNIQTHLKSRTHERRTDYIKESKRRCVESSSPVT